MRRFFQSDSVLIPCLPANGDFTLYEQKCVYFHISYLTIIPMAKNFMLVQLIYFDIDYMLCSIKWNHKLRVLYYNKH